MGSDGNISRRRMLGGMAAASGLVLAGCNPLHPGDGRSPGRPIRQPGDRPDPRKPEGTDLLPPIEHIVIYMQENHSYDSYFGAYRRGDGYRMRRGVPTNANPLTTGQDFMVFHAPDTCQRGRGVSQNWVNTHRQIDGGKMDGFLFDDNTNAMRYWDGDDVPFYWSLADTFGLCDRWFASAPCQTYPNRMYLQAGTCQGLISTDTVKALNMPHPAGGTIWEKLDEFGISWHDYCWDLPDIALFPKVWTSHLDQVRTFPQFLSDCAAGSLPAVSIVSPGVAAYTEENPRDIQLGEAYTASIVNAVTTGPAWRSTVLVFVYDEHGGYYDHVPPPAAIPPDDIPPDVASTPTVPAAWDMYGLRVPAFVISPWSRPGHISHVVNDHTSILRFIETKYNLGALTRRDANASNLLESLDLHRRDQWFPEPPPLAAPGLPLTGSRCDPSTPPPPGIPGRADTPAAAASTSAPSSAAAVPASARGLGVVQGRATTGPELTRSQDERLRLLDHLARQVTV